MTTPPSTTHERNADTFVYILQCEQFVKVGIATDVPKRVASLQPGNPFPIKVLRKVLYPSRLQALLVERTVHHVLAPHRLFSEWFTCEPTKAREALNCVNGAMTDLMTEHARLDRERIAFYDNAYATNPEYRAALERDRKESAEWLAKVRERDKVAEEASRDFDREHDFDFWSRRPATPRPRRNKAAA